MSEIVFILGAGASVSSGAPVMKNFLEKAHILLKSKQTGEYKTDFDRVFDTISDLQIIHSKSELDINNIETVFALLEMAKVIGGYGKKSVEEIEQIIESLKILIQVTLEKTIQFVPNKSLDKIKATNAYNLFCEMLREKIGASNTKFSIITYNYDYALDVALQYYGFHIDYNLTEQNDAGSIPLLKLHGSLNWFHCSECDKIIAINDYTKFIQKPPLGFSPNSPTKTLEIKSSEELDLSHCGKEFLSHAPFIVPPTWNKTEYHAKISPVWTKAAEELSNAEYIFVIGYSLPESDYFFKYLYALGTIGNNIIKGFYVFNPDTFREEMYKKMISDFTAQRFYYFDKIFQDSISNISKEMVRVNELY